MAGSAVLYCGAVDLPDREERFLLDTAGSLIAMLSDRFGCPAIPLETLPDEARDAFATCGEDKSIDGFLWRFQAEARSRLRSGSRFAVLLPQQHALPKLCLAEHPAAVWGCAWREYMAVVYGNRSNKYIIWHELLHVFNAEECYDPDDPVDGAEPICGLHGCIMQYAPRPETVDDERLLCDENVRRVRVSMTFMAKGTGPEGSDTGGS